VAAVLRRLPAGGDGNVAPSNANHSFADRRVTDCRHNTVGHRRAPNAGDRPTAAHQCARLCAACRPRCPESLRPGDLERPHLLPPPPPSPPTSPTPFSPPPASRRRPIRSPMTGRMRSRVGSGGGPVGGGAPPGKPVPALSCPAV
jgi:hypothetical protein